MSEPTAAPLDSAKRKTKTFGKQLSKSFQKGREAMKRGLLTPRGARAQEKLPAEGPPAGVIPNIPKAPVPPTHSVSEADDVDTISKPLSAGVEYVKATVEEKQDSSSPAAVVLEPVEDVATPEVIGPATPALNPSDKCVPDVQYSVDDLQTEKNVVIEKSDPIKNENEGVADGELGFEPPSVRVTVTGMPTDDSKAVVDLEADKGVSCVKPAKGSSGGAKKAILGIVALVAVSVVGFAVKGAH